MFGQGTHQEDDSEGSEDEHRDIAPSRRHHLKFNS
jgi:hypothetical protein